MAKEPDKHDGGISIALLRQGDAPTFARFVREYQDMVFACCRAVGLSDNDIEDAAAETFLAAWQSIGKFNHKCKLSSWLWSIAYHKAIDCSRKNRPAVSAVSDLTIAPAPQSTQRTPDGLERSDRVWQAVQRLSTPQAAVIVLHYREQKSIDDIAAILRMPQNTIKTHLHRGRKELYDRLQSIWENEYVAR